MSYFYFDESISDGGGFIAGAMIVSEVDLTTMVHGRWRELGFDPAKFEYKSRGDKVGSDARAIREEVHAFLEWARVGIAICPVEDRNGLGAHAVSLAVQLASTGCISAGAHTLYLDQGIRAESRELKGTEAIKSLNCLRPLFFPISDQKPQASLRSTWDKTL